MDRGNKLWTGHRMMQPDHSELTKLRCQDCRFFATIAGREENRQGCVVSVEAYSSLMHRVPQVIDALTILKLVGTEGMSRILACNDPGRAACGKFRPGIAVVKK